MNQFWEKVFGFVSGMVIKEDLNRAWVSPDAKIGTFSMPIGITGYNAMSEESTIRANIVAFMRTQLGKPYRFGIEIAPGHEADASDWDCSEITSGAYNVCGKFLPDGAQQQYDFCQPVKNALPGDLGFLWSDKRDKIGHVMMYTDVYTFIHAVGGRGVVEDHVSMWENNPRWRGKRRHIDFARLISDRY